MCLPPEAGQPPRAGRCQKKKKRWGAVLTSKSRICLTMNHTWDIQVCRNTKCWDYKLSPICMYLLTKESAWIWLTVLHNSFILEIDLKRYHFGFALKSPWHSSEQSGRRTWVQETLKLLAASLLKPPNLCELLNQALKQWLKEGVREMLCTFKDKKMETLR